MLETRANAVSVLLVDDDEEDCILTRELLSRVDGTRYDLDWASDYGAAIAAVAGRDFDVCLVDYRLGPEDGIGLVRELIADGYESPIIVLTGLGDRIVDVEATHAGAADFLVKGEVTSAVLERSIRYSMRRHEDKRALRETEEGLRQSQRMEAVGRLAGGIAHDFNNILKVIRGAAGLALDDLGEGRVRDKVQQIDSAAEHAAALTQQLLAFSRQQVLQLKPTDLNAVVAGTLDLVECLIGDHITLSRQLEPDLPAVMVDQSQVQQVILNVCVNAREAMPSGGRLRVRTTKAMLDDAYASDRAEVKPGAYCILEITDSGTGMDEETRSRIFEPFFTTKVAGTGLGLATVFGIVKQSGGHVEVYSEAGVGTTFRIYLPYADQVAAVPDDETVQEGTLTGTETILLVEDNEMIRPLVTELLEGYGYTVHAARDGLEAIGIAEADDAGIDLLLTDVVMPGLNGGELAAVLVERRPGLKVLFTSGYPAGTIVQSRIAESRVAFIQKPFLGEELARKVRATLESQPASGA
jgi:two-component system cell cycle sensor histidine kinase/response regulator CckA